MRGSLLCVVFAVLVLLVPLGRAHSEYLPALLRMLPREVKANWGAQRPVYTRAANEPFLRSSKAITQSGTNAEAYW